MVCCLSIAGRSNGQASDPAGSRCPTTTQLCVIGSLRISISASSTLEQDAVRSTSRSIFRLSTVAKIAFVALVS
jgi:hypothetical protein